MSNNAGYQVSPPSDAWNELPDAPADSDAFTNMLSKLAGESSTDGARGLSHNGPFSRKPAQVPRASKFHEHMSSSDSSDSDDASTTPLVSAKPHSHKLKSFFKKSFFTKFFGTKSASNLHKNKKRGERKFKGVAVLTGLLTTLPHMLPSIRSHKSPKSEEPKASEPVQSSFRVLEGRHNGLVAQRSQNGLYQGSQWQMQ